MKELTPRRKRFVTEYCIDWNASRAAIAAGYSAASATAIACELLTFPDVIAEVEKRKAVIATKAELKVEDVVRSIAAVIRADPRELTETHMGACRHCWGAYHLYQYKPQEFRDAYAAWQRGEANIKTKTSEPFDAKGGDGYLMKRDPHPECPECEGRGTPYTVIKDTSLISADAAQLFMGVKQTANGVEILTRSKDKAIEQAARYLGMNKEQVLTITAPSGLGHFYGETK